MLKGKKKKIKEKERRKKKHENKVLPLAADPSVIKAAMCPVLALGVIHCHFNPRMFFKKCHKVRL